MKTPSRFNHELTEALRSIDRGECHLALTNLLSAYRHYGRDSKYKDERSQRVSRLFTTRCIRR